MQPIFLGKPLQGHKKYIISQRSQNPLEYHILDTHINGKQSKPLKIKDIMLFTTKISTKPKTDLIDTQRIQTNSKPHQKYIHN